LQLGRNDFQLSFLLRLSKACVLYVLWIIIAIVTIKTVSQI